MKIILETIAKFFKNINLRDILYITVLGVFILSALAAFVWSVIFFGRSINYVVGKPDTANVSSTAFDLNSFSLIASRLNISFSLSTKPAPAEEIPAPAPLPPPPPEKQPPLLIEPASDGSDGKNISNTTIHVLNGANKRGIAGIWKEILEAGGFSGIITGDAARKNYQGITIHYKPSAEFALDNIRKIVADRNAVISSEKTEEETAKFDITIIVGK